VQGYAGDACEYCDDGYVLTPVVDSQGAATGDSECMKVTSASLQNNNDGTVEAPPTTERVRVRPASGYSWVCIGLGTCQSFCSCSTGALQRGSAELQAALHCSQVATLHCSACAQSWHAWR
jgi:hypothetical protein